MLILFSKVEVGDDRMYWCEVSIQDGGEFKFDAASTVMRIHDTEDQSLPKFHQVNTVKSLLQATEGGKITLDCRLVTYLLYLRHKQFYLSFIFSCMIALSMNNDLVLIYYKIPINF